MRNDLRRRDRRDFPWKGKLAGRAGDENIGAFGGDQLNLLFKLEWHPFIVGIEECDQVATRRLELQPPLRH